MHLKKHSCTEIHAHFSYFVIIPIFFTIVRVMTMFLLHMYLCPQNMSTKQVLNLLAIIVMCINSVGNPIIYIIHLYKVGLLRVVFGLPFTASQYCFGKVFPV